jgi:transcriptional regulator with XRE-family HTH domain
MAELTPEYEALSAVLIQARVDAKLTQRELASKLNRLHTFVSKIETEGRRIDVIEFIELARALGVDPAKLLNRVIRAAAL